MKIVSIHQPNFLPWLGFFHKWMSSDTFILLDEVQLVRRTYLTRTSIFESGKAGMIHVPVHHTGQQSVSIRDAQIDTAQWRPVRFLRRLKYAYSKSPFWGDLIPALEAHMSAPHTHLVQLNRALIDWIGLELLQLSSETCIAQSALQAEGKGSQLMANLTKQVGGTHYLSGGRAPEAGREERVGAAAYNRPEDFAEQDLQLVYQNFSPQPYREPFISGLSILDCLFYLGPDGTRAHLSSYSSPGLA